MAERKFWAICEAPTERPASGFDTPVEPKRGTPPPKKYYYLHGGFYPSRLTYSHPVGHDAFWDRGEAIEALKARASANPRSIYYLIEAVASSRCDVAPATVDGLL